MKKIKLGLDSNLSLDQRKERIEKIVHHLAKDEVVLDERDFDYNFNRSRMINSAKIILWCSIIGTTLLAASSLYYVSIPDPVAYATTQDGRLIELVPIRKDR